MQKLNGDSLKDRNVSPEKQGEKSVAALAVLAVFLLVLGAGALVFTFVYSDYLKDAEPQSVKTEVYEEIPENATPVKKDIPDDLSNYEEPSDSPATKLINVPYINQRKKYPTGCESISAVMALNYAGYDISPEDFIANYLPQSPVPYIDESGKLYGYNPYSVFLGSPYSADGWGCYYTVIGRCISKIVDGNRHKVLNLHRATFKACFLY